MQLDLTKAEDARTYVLYFRTEVLPGAKFVDTQCGRRIYFSEMTDEDAIDVAHMLYDLENQAEIRKAKKATKH